MQGFKNKILIITNLYPPYVLGGAETYLEKLVQSLSRANYKVGIITARPFFKGLKYEKTVYANIYRTYNANIFFEGNFSNKKSYLKFLWRFFSLVLPVFNLVQIYLWIKREKPDVIHTHNLHGFHPLLLVILKLTKTPIVHTIHDYFFLCPRLSLLHRDGYICGQGEQSLNMKEPRTVCLIYRNIFSKLIRDTFTTVTAPSSFALDIHKTNGLFNESKTISIPLGTTFETTVSRKNKEYPVSRFNFIYIGALSKHKGIHVLIEAVKLTRDIDYSMTIVGDGDLRSDIQDLCKKDSRIEFLGFVQGKKKTDVFSKSTCMLLPSVWYDNSPVVIYESFSYGIPVIASSIGGIPELIKHRSNGLLFTPGSANELAKAMNELFLDHDLFVELSKNSFRCSDEYSFEKHVEKISNVYSNVIRVPKHT